MTTMRFFLLLLGFNQGIRAEKGNGLYALSVTNSHFKNNFIGLKVMDYSNPWITANTFDVSFDAATSFGPPTGLILWSCTGYTVEENDIQGTTTAQGGLDNTIGILIRDSGDEYNEVYRNNLSNAAYANLSNGDNRNEAISFLGLQYRCNTNNNNTYDFAVPDETGFSEGISSSQGRNIEPAGNVFSHHSTPLGSDFNNESSWPSSYWYNENNLAEEPINVVGIAKNKTGDVNTCESHIFTGGEEEEGDDRDLEIGKRAFFQQTYFSAQQAYDTLRNHYLSLMDGGNTSILLDEIATATVAQSTLLENNLLSHTPYLSEKVLQAAADRDEVLSDQQLYNILLATPDEARKPSLQDYLLYKTNPFPSALLDSLKNSSDTISPRTEMEAQMAALAGDYTYAANRMLQHFLADTTEVVSDSVRYWLSAKESLSADYTLINTYLTDHNVTTAWQYLNQIPQNRLLSAKQQEEYNDLLIFLQMQMDWINNQENMADLDSSSLFQLESLANKSWGKGSYGAQSILNFFYDYDYQHIPVLLAAQPQARIQMPASERTLADAEIWIKAQPNPARDILNLEYSLATDQGTLVLLNTQGEILRKMDVSHRKGEVQMAIGGIPAGIYFYGIQTKGALQAVEKVMIH